MIKDVPMWCSWIQRHSRALRGYGESTNLLRFFRFLLSSFLPLPFLVPLPHPPPSPPSSFCFSSIPLLSATIVTSSSSTLASALFSLSSYISSSHAYSSFLITVTSLFCSSFLSHHLSYTWSLPPINFPVATFLIPCFGAFSSTRSLPTIAPLLELLIFHGVLYQDPFKPSPARCVRVKEGFVLPRGSVPRSSSTPELDSWKTMASISASVWGECGVGGKWGEEINKNISWAAMEFSHTIPGIFDGRTDF